MTKDKIVSPFIEKIFILTLIEFKNRASLSHFEGVGERLRVKGKIIQHKTAE